MCTHKDRGLMKRKKTVGHSDKGGRGKNGKDKRNKTNLIM